TSTNLAMSAWLTFREAGFFIDPILLPLAGPGLYANLRNTQGLAQREALACLPACCDMHAPGDPAAARGDHVIMQIADRADVVGHDGDPLADFRAPRVACRQVDHAVFLGQGAYDGLRIARDMAETIGAVAGNQIASQRLGAGIDHCPVRRRTADDGTMDVQRAILETRRAGTHRIAVMINVSADAQLIDFLQLMGAEGIGRAAARDQRDRQAGKPEMA